MPHEIPQPAMPRIVHQEHRGLLVALAQILPGERAGVGLPRIAPQREIVQDVVNVVVPCEYEAPQQAVVVHRLPPAQLGEHRIGVVSEAWIERGELDSGRERRPGRVRARGPHRVQSALAG